MSRSVQFMLCPHEGVSSNPQLRREEPSVAHTLVIPTLRDGDRKLPGAGSSVREHKGKHCPHTHLSVSVCECVLVGIAVLFMSGC